MRVRKLVEDGVTAEGWTAHSITEHGIGNGIVSFFVELGLLFAGGERVRATADVDPAAYVGGIVLGYYPADETRALLDIQVDNFGLVSDATYTAWTIETFVPARTGDFRWGNGPADYHHNTAEGVAQTVMTRLRLFRGEWFLDVTEGTPWFGAVLGVRTRQTIEPALRARILGTPGVVRIDAFDVVIDSEARTVAIAATITTEFGPAELQGVL